MEMINRHSIDALIDKLEELEELTKEYNTLAQNVGEEPMARAGIPKYLYDTEYCRKEKEQLMSFTEEQQARDLERIDSQFSIIYMFLIERINMVKKARNELLRKYSDCELDKIA